MERIMIISTNSGAGKSTLARSLGEKLSIEPVHLDALFVKPNWVMLTDEELGEKIMEVVPKNKWIIDGAYAAIKFKERVERADVIIMFDFNRFKCFYGAVKRHIMYYKKPRPDLGEGCVGKFDWKSAWNILWYSPRNRKRRLSRLEKLTDKNIYIFKNRKQVASFLEGVSKFDG